MNMMMCSSIFHYDVKVKSIFDFTKQKLKMKQNVLQFFNYFPKSKEDQNHRSPQQ